MKSTNFTARLIALPVKVPEPLVKENGWLCEPPPPVGPDEIDERIPLP